MRMIVIVSSRCTIRPETLHHAAIYLKELKSINVLPPALCSFLTKWLADPGSHNGYCRSCSGFDDFVVGASIAIPIKCCEQE